MPETEAEWFAHFEEMGEPQVRDTAPQWPPIVNKHAYRWLAAQERSREERNDASQAAQLALARRAAAEAEQANQIAKTSKMIAIVGTTVSILIALLSWLFPHH